MSSVSLILYQGCQASTCSGFLIYSPVSTYLITLPCIYIVFFFLARCLLVASSYTSLYFCFGTPQVMFWLNQVYFFLMWLSSKLSAFGHSYQLQLRCHLRTSVSRSRCQICLKNTFMLGNYSEKAWHKSKGTLHQYIMYHVMNLKTV